MAKELIIPDEHALAFNRLMQRIPSEFREDPTIRRTALIYLKVGGEKLARASIKALTTPFTERFILRKMQINDDDVGTTDPDTEKPAEEAGDESSKDESTDNEDVDPSPPPDTPSPK